MNKADKQSLIFTFVIALLAAIILGTVFFSPGFDQESNMAVVKSEYFGCPVVQTHAGVYIVRKKDNSVWQVRTAGVFHVYIKEAKELIPQNTIF